MGLISLKAARTNANLTQKELAEKLGVRPATIGSWENGLTLPNILEAMKIGEVCGIRYDEIYWGKNFAN